MSVNLDTADRSMVNLQQFFGLKLVAILEYAHAKEWDIRLVEGYRSNARSDYLYEQGRTRPGNVVTKARGGASRHNYSIAADLYPYPLGKIDLDFERSPKLLSQFVELAKYAKSIGVSWGGNWSSFKDYPHFEIDRPDITTLKNLYPYGWLPGKSKEKAWIKPAVA